MQEIKTFKLQRKSVLLYILEDRLVIDVIEPTLVNDIYCRLKKAWFDVDLLRCYRFPIEHNNSCDENLKWKFSKDLQIINPENIIQRCYFERF